MISSCTNLPATRLGSVRETNMKLKRTLPLVAIVLAASVYGDSADADAAGFPQVREILAYRGNYTARSSRASPRATR